MKIAGILAMLLAWASSACARTDRGSSEDAHVQPGTDTIVQGRVLGTGDSALGGVRVSATLFAPASRIPTSQRYDATTNSAGHYQLELPPAEYLVQVIHRGHAARRDVVRLSRGQQLRQDWRLLPSGSVSGKVLTPNGAVSGASVALVMLDTHDLLATSQQTAVSSADGHFRFEEVPPGLARLTVRGPGLFSEAPGIINVAPGQETKDLALQTRAAYAIRGAVVHADDPQRLLEDTPVSALNLATGESFESTQPGAAAAFEIVDVPPGHYALRAGVSGTSGSNPVVVRMEADLVDQKVPAIPRFRVAGRIQPELEATITVSEPSVSPDLPPLILATEYIPQGTRTFSLRGIPKGEAILAVAGGDGWRAYQVVKVDRDLDDVVVNLTQTVPIRGRVADDRGVPVPGVTVVAVPQRDPIGVDEREAATVARDVTGPDGFFTLAGVSARSVTLQVRDGFGRLLKGGASAPVKTTGDTLALSDLAVESNLTVPSCGEKVRGRVRDLARRPVSLASVQLAAIRNQRDEPYLELPSLAALTGPDGRFEFSGLCQKRYELVAANAARTAGSVVRYTSASEANLELTLRPRRRLELSLRHQGQPVTEYGVEFFGKTEYRFPVRSAAGRVLSPLLDPGMLRIVAVANDGYVDQHLRLSEGTPVTSAHLDLQPWSTVQGRVVDAAGSPVTAAWVAVSIRPPGLSGSTPQLAMAHLSAQVQTDRAGRFQARRLMHGKLFLRVAKAGRLLTLRRARVETSAEPLIGRGTITSESLGEGQTLDLGDVELYPGAAGDD